MAERVLMKGNEALARSGNARRMSSFLRLSHHPPDRAFGLSVQNDAQGRRHLSFRQNSEVAAINMVLGAASAGVRAMTSLLFSRHLPEMRGHFLHSGLRPALRHCQRAARRPGSGRHPALPGGLLAGHQSAGPRRPPRYWFLPPPPFRRW